MPLYLNGKRIAPTKLVYSGGYETYTGNYTINPATTNIVLSTTNKLLTQNITVNAMPALVLPTEPSSSASSGYTVKATISRNASDRYINIGTGYNSSNVYYKISAVPDGTAGTPVATKGSVSDNSISITPSVTNITGYITGNTITGTAISVAASELVSGTLSITSNGTKDVTNYKNVNVQIGSDVNNQDKTISPTISEQIITADSGYSGLGTVTINAMPSGTVTAPASISGSSATVSNGTNTITLTKTISVTPNVTTAGYVSSGTAGNASVSLTANVTTKGATSYTPTTTSQTITSGTYLTGNQTILGDSNLVAGNIKKNISIFGVTGTYEPPAGDTINNQDKTVTPTESEQSISADSGYTGLGVVTVEGISSTYVGSDITRRTSSSLTASGATVTVPAGYYATQATKTIANGTAGTPTATKGTVSNNSISVTPSVTNTTGYITGSTKIGTAVTVSASELVSGNKSIISNGTNIDVTNYATVSVAVPTGSTISNQDKTVSPSTSQQTITADEGYTGLGTVTINAMPALTLPTTVSNSATSGYTKKVTIGRSTSTQYINIGTGYNSAGGYYEISAVADGTAGTPTATKGTVSNNSISITPSVTNITGYITGGTKSGTAVTVSASELVSGNKAISANGTNIDVTNYATVSVSVGSDINNQNKTVTPSESEQSITADSGYSGLGTVVVEAISSTYVGSGITQRTSSSLTVSGATVSVPAGYYAEAASKSVTTMTLPTATSASATSGYMSKATISRSISDQYINIAPGYNNAGGYYKISAIANGGATNSGSASGSSATITTGTNTITLTKSISITPTVTEGYISNGTAGNVSVALTASAAVNPTPTVSGATVTIPVGYYTEAATASVSSMTLPTTAASSATSGYTSKATISRSTSAQYINIPPGYNSTGGYYTISATPNGSVTAPSTISGTAASVSTGTNTLTLTKTISVTPNVTTAGYISAGTAGNSSISLTATVATQGARIISPSTTDEIITSGTYLTGNMTVKAVQISGLTAANIKSGVTIKVGDELDDDCVAGITGTFTNDATATAADIIEGETAYVGGRQVTGTLVINNYYTGSSTPSSSLGSNGDIYIQQ